MNKVVLMGRLTKDPEIRYSQGTEPISNAIYIFAVDMRFNKDGEPAADFISCVVFGKVAEFTQKYLKKGTKIALSGRIQTGSYTNNEGKKVYTTDVVVEECELAESKAVSEGNTQEPPQEANEGDFMAITEGIEDDLPFK